MVSSCTVSERHRAGCRRQRPLTHPGHTRTGVLMEDLFHFLTLLVALTMTTTPLMANFCEYVGKCLTKATVRHDVSTNHIDAGQPHVIIAGFGRVGRRVSRILQTGNVPYLAIESNADRVLDGRQEGFSVFYGDASQVDVLKAAGAGQASVLVCTLDQAVSAVRLVISCDNITRASPSTHADVTGNTASSY